MTDQELHNSISFTIRTLRGERRRLSDRVRLITRAISAMEGEQKLLERDWAALPAEVARHFAELDEHDQGQIST